jgi:hypothetical protein
MKTIEEIKHMMEKLTNERNLNIDRFEHFKKVGDRDKCNLYIQMNGAITAKMQMLDWILEN